MRTIAAAVLMLALAPMAHGIPTTCTINYPGGCHGTFEEDPENEGYGMMRVTCNWVIVYENYGAGSCDGHGARA